MDGRRRPANVDGRLKPPPPGRENPDKENDHVRTLGRARLTAVRSPIAGPVRLPTYGPTVGKGGGGGPAFNGMLVVQGQSNALASGPTSVPSQVAAIDPNRVKIWDGSAFVGYVAGTNSEPTGAFPAKWGPEAPYAIRWLAAHPRGTLYIVKRAVSGTAISTWQSGQTNFDNATDWVDAADAALSGVEIHARNLLWAQGESDAIVNQALADAYEAGLTSFLASARSEWGVTRVAAMRVYRANLAYGATVRAAQKAVALADADTMLVNTDDLTLVDTYHYDLTGVLAIGDRMYDAISTGLGFEYEATKSLSNLTGASAPTGYAASASSNFNSTFTAWKAFDGSLNESTGRWATAVPVPGLAATLTLQTPTAVKFGAFTYKIYSDGANSAPGTMVLEGSNDGSNWWSVYSVSGLSWTNNETKLFEIPTSQRGSYSQHRWSLSVPPVTSFSALEITPLLAP